MNNGTFNTIEDAVLCFYSSNHALQGEAQKWLTQLQETPQIWDIIWKDLLPSEHTELQFYGATILHSKLLKDWNEIPADQYVNLKNRLLEAVVFFKDGSKTVLNRICISLAVFLIRTVTTFWPNAVADLISLLGNPSPSILENYPNVSPEMFTWLLLEILIVIPEEFQTIILSKNDKIFIRHALEADESSVIAFLEAALNSPNIEVQSQAVRCARSWLEFGLPPEECDNFLNLLIRIVLLTYKNVEAWQRTTIAIEAISLLCTHENMSKYPRKVVDYLKKILCLADILGSSQEITNGDLIPNLYTLFVDTGETHLKVFITTLLTDERTPFLKLLHVILQCSRAPGCYPKDEVYSIQTFNFWYSLQDEILSTEFRKSEEILNIIKPFYKELMLVLMEKSMQPSDMSDWSRDDKDSFRCYQQDIEDTYAYCYSMLDEEFLDIIAQFLQQALKDPVLLMNWRRVDSYLRAFCAVSESAICSNDCRILHCILLLEKLPLANMDAQVSQTVMALLGSYAEWLCSYPHLLEPVLSLVFVGAENPQLALPATLALKDITRECHSVLLPFSEGMADKMMELLKRQHFHHKEQVRVTYSLGKVISLLSADKIMRYLQEIASPYIVKIEVLLSTVPENPKKVEIELAHCVEIFTQLFLGLVVKPVNPSVDPPVDPVLCLLKEILPRFQAILAQYKGQTFISSMCIAIKCAVSNLRESCAELLPAIVDVVLSTYFTNPDHSLLELAKQLLILFGSNSAYTELMSNMLRRICELTLTKFENTTPDNVSEHTLLFEHFYSFCTNVLKKNCRLLLETDGVNLVSLFRFAGYALCAQEVPTVKSSSSFLCNVITVSREQDALLMIVQAYGAELVNHVLIAIGKVSPRNCLEHVAEVLVALSKKYCDCLSRWLNELLAPEGFPTPRATAAAKNRFIKSILRDKANKRRVLDVTKEFSFLCRGLLNKDYVDVTASAL